MRIFLMLFLAMPAWAQSVSLQEYLKAPSNYGNIIMIRHELAPGGGDPGHFDVNDCKTQRNLSDQGRQRAKATGERLKQAGYRPDRVFSSPWCRCHESARLMDIKPVEIHWGLASFFEDHVDRTETLEQLNQLIGELGDQTALMVTHFVVISALTGQGVGSGQAVIYDPTTQRSWRLMI